MVNHSSHYWCGCVVYLQNYQCSKRFLVWFLTVCCKIIIFCKSYVFGILEKRNKPSEHSYHHYRWSLATFLRAIPCIFKHSRRLRTNRCSCVHLLQVWCGFDKNTPCPCWYPANYESRHFQSIEWSNLNQDFSVVWHIFKDSGRSHQHCSDPVHILVEK